MFSNQAVEDAFKAAPEPSLFCEAVERVIPTIRSLRDSASRWKFWVRPVLSALIAVLESRCPNAKQ